MNPVASFIRSRGFIARASVAVVSLLFAAPALAETLYVTDILRLGLHQASDTSDRPFRVLASGDALEVIERSQFYARVRTEDGVEGYVKASYLVDEMPARTMLTSLTSERDRLSAEVAGLNARIADQELELTNLRGDRDSLEQNARTVAGELSALRNENETLGQRVAAQRLSVPLPWMLVVAGVMLVGGFAGGWWWTDARQRARHGGFRI